MNCEQLRESRTSCILPGETEPFAGKRIVGKMNLKRLCHGSAASNRVSMRYMRVTQDSGVTILRAGKQKVLWIARTCRKPDSSGSTAIRLILACGGSPLSETAKSCTSSSARLAQLLYLRHLSWAADVHGHYRSSLPQS